MQKIYVKLKCIISVFLSHWWVHTTFEYTVFGDVLITSV